MPEISSLPKPPEQPKEIEKIYHPEGAYIIYPCPEQKQDGITLCAFSNIGAGHGNFALRLARELARAGGRNVMVGETGEILKKYATEEELQAIEQLDNIHRKFLVETLYKVGLTSDLGLKIVNRISSSGLVIKNRTPLPDYSSASALEEKLVEPFVKMVNAMNIKDLYVAHPSIASIAEKAKKKGLLREDFRIVNCVFDPIDEKNRLTTMLYDNDAVGDKHYAIVTSAESTAEAMAKIGYSKKSHIIFIRPGEWKTGETQEEEGVVQRKLKELEKIYHEGVSKEHPIRLALVCDNFSTQNETEIAKQVSRKLSREIREGLVKLTILGNKEELEIHLREALKLGFSEKDLYLFNRSGLGRQKKDDLTRLFDQNAKDLPKITLVNRDVNPDNDYPHEYFMDIQEAVISGSHGIIGRPSEAVRVAALHGAFSLCVRGFGFQEEHMAKLYEETLKIAKRFLPVNMAIYFMRNEAGIPHLLTKTHIKHFYEMVTTAINLQAEQYFGEGNSGIGQTLLNHLNAIVSYIDQ